MKVIVHVLADNRVNITHLNPKLLEVMTGQGLGWSQERIDLEVGKFTDPPDPEIGKLDSVVRPYISGIAFGGLSVDDAIDLVNAKDDPEGCTGCVIVDDSDLPSDRSMRDQWLWDPIDGRIVAGL